MAIGTIHDLGNGLHIIEGHHPETLWDDPDIPSIAVYHRGDHVYLFDTGAGPVQRAAILDVVSAAGHIGELRLLNSHGHVDHLGNNDLLGEIGAEKRLHRLPRAARPALDYDTFFRTMYASGTPYFDYIEGLELDPARITSLLRHFGAPDVAPSDVADLGRRIHSLGIDRALSSFLPGVVVDILLSTYPTVHPSIDTMGDFEDDGPAQVFELGGVEFTGWYFTDAEGEPEVYALQSGGHSAGGLIFFLPHARAILMADETTAVPIWGDSDPTRARSTAERVLAMIDAGLVDHLAAGHRPLLPVTGSAAMRAAVTGIVQAGDAFVREIETVLSATPGGLSIDELFSAMRAAATPTSVTTVLLKSQFPVFATFFKLTLLNHCRFFHYTEIVGEDGVPRFSLARNNPGS